MGNENIKIAFCFDNNLMYQACITIASLVKAGIKEHCHYDIYCICSNGAEKIKTILEKIINKIDSSSNIFIIKAENEYENGYEIRNITAGAYLRLQLHKLLPNIDKIIYSDIDVLFQTSIAEVWNYEINNKLFLGVKGAINLNIYWNSNCQQYTYWNNFTHGAYINSGFVVMNLKNIRESNIDKEWGKMVTEPYFYVDQDIINISCKNQIGFLPLKYNVPAYLSTEQLFEFEKENLYTKTEVLEAVNSPAIIHYAGEKPWNNSTINHGKEWINFVKSDRKLKHIYYKYINKPESVLQKIFSIKNYTIKNKKYKIITIFGIKIKTRLNNKQTDVPELLTLPASQKGGGGKILALTEIRTNK